LHEKGIVPLIIMILRFLFYAFVCYLIIKLVVNVIIPIYRTTRQVKKGFREMQERMHQQAGPFGDTPAAKQPKPDNVGGEYIDFEEVK
jgi:hypothetical protein